MGKIISLKERIEAKKAENAVFDSYISKNSIVLQYKDNEDFEIAVVLDMNGDESITVDTLIDPDNLLVNLVIADEENPDREPSYNLLYKPRFGDAVNLVAQYLENQGIKNTIAFLYDIEKLDPEDNNGNNWLVYFYDSGSALDEEI